MELNRYGHGDRGSRTDTADSFALVSPVIVAGPSERSFSGTILAPRPRASGLRITAANGNQYRLTLADGRWTSAFLPPEPVPVGLGASGEVVLVARTEGGSYQVGGQAVVSGSVVRSSTGAAYRLAMQDGAWTAAFEPPPPVAVSLGASGQTVRLQLGEDGSYRRDGQPFASGTTVEAGGESFLLTLQNGRWTAVSQAPVLQTVRLGTSAVTLTLQRTSGGGWSEDGEPVRNGEVRTVGGNRYRLLLDDGEWSAEYLRGTIPVDGAGGLIILFREEDGTLTHDGDRVSDGSVITQDGRTYELLRLSDGTWLATPGAPPPAAGDQTVSLPGGQTVTLRRTSGGTYTYNGAPVSDGGQITVGANRYVLTRASDDTWSARTVRDTTTVDTGGIAGPTQTDTVEDFTDDRFDDAGNKFGVQFSTRDQQPSDADDRGTKIVPQRDGATHVEFPVYELMQQELVTQERTYVDVAKAKLQEIVDIIRLNKDLYARDARDPDDHIADDVRINLSTTAESSIGLWRQAEMAVGQIFGLTDDEDMDGILGGDPWRGLTLDLDEVDAVIEALEDTIAVLSDVGRFGREYEEQIAKIIGGTDRTVGTEDDLDLDAADFFNGLMTRIRFGSTTGTRFGAYVVKEENGSNNNASDGARGNWTKGVFAYTPSDAPLLATDIPDRGEATFRGSTVAVSGVDPANRKGATLYAGTIELVASFTRKNVKGTITELKDESGRTFTYNDGFGNEVVQSIVLPDAEHSTTDGEIGFYQEDAGTSSPATAIFADSSLPNAPSLSAKFRVQLVDDAGEALGVWEAFELEGAFGATRTGTVSKPTLPREADRGGGATTGSIHYITNSNAGTGSGGPITANTEESTFSLTREQLGISGDVAVIDDDEWSDNFVALELTDLYRRSRTARAGSTFVSEARTQISGLRTGLDENNYESRASQAGPILEKILGISGITLTASDRSTASSEIGKAVSALGSATALHRALTHEDVNDARDGFFLNSSTEWDLDQTRQVYSEKRWDFKYDFGHNKYTRFGVWSQIAPENAGDNVDGSTADEDSAPHHGSFAYSPLAPADAANVNGLTFAATYEGRTLAVNEGTGDLYSGQIILRVNWEDPATVSSTITDLKGVRGTSDYFKYGTKNVKSIFFTGLTVTGGALSGAPGMRVRYRDSTQDTTAAGSITAAMQGNFVMDPDFLDEPVGVLGVWSITDTGTTVDNYSASFGAELKP